MTQDKNTAPQIPREDDLCDVLGKAMRGQELTTAALAAKASLPEQIIRQALQAEGSDLAAGTLASIASALGLNPNALATLNKYQPVCQPPEKLTTITTSFGHAGVNAFIVDNGQSACVFDTGTDPSPILNFLSSQKLTLAKLYITHEHHDHCSGVSAFPDEKIILPADLSHGESLSPLPGIQITALETSGHYTPSVAFFIEGLTSPVCICGDILFAGSMGKTPNLTCYRQSIRYAREHILSLPPETILCPGHGPLSTVALEQEHNPFLA